LAGGGFVVPTAQKGGIAGIAYALANGGAMFAIGTEQVVAHRLGEANIAGKGAVAGGHQHFLPVAEVGGAAGGYMAGFLLQSRIGGQQHIPHFGHGTAIIKPVVFARALP
jgi:hypothetical protein